MLLWIENAIMSSFMMLLNMVLLVSLVFILYLLVILSYCGGLFLKKQSIKFLSLSTLNWKVNYMFVFFFALVYFGCILFGWLLIGGFISVEAMVGKFGFIIKVVMSVAKVKFALEKATVHLFLPNILTVEVPMSDFLIVKLVLLLLFVGGLYCMSVFLLEFSESFIMFVHSVFKISAEMSVASELLWFFISSVFFIAGVFFCGLCINVWTFQLVSTSSAMITFELKSTVMDFGFSAEDLVVFTYLLSFKILSWCLFCYGCNKIDLWLKLYMKEIFYKEWGTLYMYMCVFLVYVGAWFCAIVIVVKCGGMMPFDSAVGLGWFLNNIISGYLVGVGVSILFVCPVVYCYYIWFLAESYVKKYPDKTKKCAFWVNFSISLFVVVYWFMLMMIFGTSDEQIMGVWFMYLVCMHFHVVYVFLRMAVVLHAAKMEYPLNSMMFDSTYDICCILYAMLMYFFAFFLWCLFWVIFSAMFGWVPNVKVGVKQLVFKIFLYSVRDTSSESGVSVFSDFLHVGM